MGSQVRGQYKGNKYTIGRAKKAKNVKVSVNKAVEIPVWGQPGAKGKVRNRNPNHPKSNCGWGGWGKNQPTQNQE